jgi:hypothetical protein
MAAYEFKTADGEIVEVFMTFAEHERRVKDDTITLDDGRKAKTFWNANSKISTTPSNYPMVSSAAGVHPADIKAHMDHLRAGGLGQVNHTKDGDIIFESAGQRKRVCEFLGLYDRNGSFSDPQPKYRTANSRKYR